MRELGDNLTPPTVVKMIEDACLLMFGKPNSVVEQDGTERPLSEAERSETAEALIEGSVARLSQWWRQGEEPQVAEVLNALDEDTLRVLAAAAVSKLGDLGYTIAAHPDVPPGTDPRLN